jgi:hypothetical protein
VTPSRSRPVSPNLVAAVILLAVLALLVVMTGGAG